jgi:hypothetical protein
MKRNTYNIQQRLDAIFRRGDMDECSTKHIFWGLASLLKGKRWYELGDYPIECMRDGQKEYITARWERLEEIREDVGLVKFKELIANTSFEMDIIELYMARGES